MGIDYQKLWDILAKLSKGDYILMEGLQKICKAFNCDVGDVCVINESDLEK